VKSLPTIREMRTVAAAADDAGRVEAWNAVQRDEPVAREISAFSAAVEKRFGEESVRAMLRTQRPWAKPNEGDASAPNEHRAAAAEVVQTVVAIQAGEGAAESRSQAEHLAHRASQGARAKP